MDIDNECSGCGRIIPIGEPYWTVNVQQEVFEDEVTVEIRDCVVYYTFCTACAEKMDFDKVSVPEKVPK